MDDLPKELADLETELKRLRPRAPSESLLGRIGRELDGATPKPTDTAARSYRTATTWTHWKWLGWPAAVAAAVFALVAVGVLGLRPDRAPAAPTTVAADYVPVRADNVLYEVRDEGYVTLDDHTPAQQVRLRYLDTYTWKNPKNNASVKWTFPRDEIRIVPASYH